MLVPSRRTPSRYTRPLRLTAAAALCLGLAATAAAPAGARVAGQAERLDRGAVSVRSGDGNLVTWRLLGTDPAGTGFHVYRDGYRITPTHLTGATNLLDAGAPAGARYEIREVVDGVAGAFSAPALQFGAGYLDVPLQVPAGARSTAVRTRTRRATSPSGTPTATGTASCS